MLVKNRHTKELFYVADNNCLGKDCFEPTSITYDSVTYKGKPITDRFIFGCKQNLSPGCPVNQEYSQATEQQRLRDWSYFTWNILEQLLDC